MCGRRTYTGARSSWGLRRFAGGAGAAIQGRLERRMPRASSTDRVDPELIAARLKAVRDDETRAEAQAIVDAALSCFVRLGEVDMSGLGREVAKTAPSALWGSANLSVAAMWLAIEELQQVMQPLLEATKGEPQDGMNLDAFSSGEHGAGPQAAVAVPVVAAPTTLNPILKRISETTWAMSFVLSGEVQAFRKRLSALLKLRESWELMDAVEDHLEHVRSAVVALLNGVFAALPAGQGGDAEAEASFVLTSSRELRSRVVELRDEILAVEREVNAGAPGAWVEPLKRARAAVEAFMFGPGFAWMRAGDKRTFLGQRQALTEILELWSPLRAVPAKHAVENLARFLEALEVVNQRECLVNHDRARLETVVAKLELAVKSRGAAARPPIGAALAALSEVQGRDRDLDRLLSQSMDPSREIPVREILERARAVLKPLAG